MLILILSLSFNFLLSDWLPTLLTILHSLYATASVCDTLCGYNLRDLVTLTFDLHTSHIGYRFTIGDQQLTSLN